MFGLLMACKDVDLDAILCIKTVRTVKNDLTIQHDKKLYQIEDRIKAKKVMVEELIDGTMKIRHNRTLLCFHEIPRRPQKEQKERPIIEKGKGHKPRPDHPWLSGRRRRKTGPCGNMEKAPPLPHSHTTTARGS